MTSTPSPEMPATNLDSGSQPLPPPPPAPPARPPLQRSHTDHWLGGVCGGLAEHTGIDSLVWRVGFIAFTLAGGSGVLVYLLLWVLIPDSPHPADQQLSRLDRMAEQAHQKVYATGWIPPKPGQPSAPTSPGNATTP